MHTNRRIQIRASYAMSPRRISTNRDVLRPSIIAIVGIILCVLGVLESRPAHAEKWALLIGIDTYKDSGRIDSLGSAAADARAMKKALIETQGVPESNIRLLVSDADAARSDTEAKPERNRILRDLAGIAKNARPGDTVYVFFSGHGIEKNGVSYLLPFDADAFDDNTIADTSIEVTKLRDRLQTVHAGLLIMAFDMCRNNPLKGSRDASGQANTMKPSQVKGLDFGSVSANGGTAPVTGVDGPTTVVTLFSCSPDERSYEWSDKGRGYFSYYLEQGLRGTKDAMGPDGAVHIDSLTKYVSRSVTEAVQRNEGNAQTPLVEIRGQADARDIALTPGASPATEVTHPIELAADPRAYLRLLLSPEDAIVSVDGVVQTPAAGRVTLDLAGIATKSFEIGVQAKGYHTLVEQLTVARGTIVPLAVTLTPLGVLPPPTHPPTSVPAPSTGSVSVNPIDGAEMVLIPAGEFDMGDDDVPDNPRHKVRLAAYYIYKYPVTVAMYQKFCKATNRPMPDAPAWGFIENYPIVMVQRFDAEAYCEWAGARLPTEAQWEKAARGTDGRRYPWGNEFDHSRLGSSTSQYGDSGHPVAVGSFPTGASPYGVMDMMGSVFQWCQDTYDANFWTSSEAKVPDPVNDSPPGLVTLRGGGWGFWLPDYARTARRDSNGPEAHFADFGFRCAISVPNTTPK